MGWCSIIVIRGMQTYIPREKLPCAIVPSQSCTGFEHEEPEEPDNFKKFRIYWKIYVKSGLING
jgi:hypothetical protein